VGWNLLVGQQEHALDAKGRVFIPARFRTPFQADGGILSGHNEGCLALFTREHFEARWAQLAQRSEESEAARDLARFLGGFSQDVTLDGQGRIPLSPALREFAHLSGAVLVVGVVDHLELWEPGRYRSRMEPVSGRMQATTETGGTVGAEM
jgi:MraZ protein